MQGKKAVYVQGGKGGSQITNDGLIFNKITDHDKKFWWNYESRT